MCHFIEAQERLTSLQMTMEKIIWEQEILIIKKSTSDGLKYIK